MEVVTHITQAYHAATQQWHHYLFPIANRLFAMLAIIELAWAGIWWAIEKNEVTSLLSEFLRKIIVLGIFYSIMLNANQWIPSIIKSFMWIGAGSAKTTHLYPSDIFEQGLAIAGNMLSSLGYSAFIYNPFAAVSVYISAFFVSVGYALIAAQIVVAQVEAYVIVGAGAVLLGFSASSFTRSISLNYFNYAINLGIRLFILFMIIGVGMQITMEWVNIAKSNFIEFPTACFEIIGGVIIFVYLVWVIPQKAQGLMTGLPEHRVRQVSAIFSSMTKGVSQLKSTFLSNKSASDSRSQSLHEAIKQNSKMPASLGTAYQVSPSMAGNHQVNAGKISNATKLANQRTTFNRNQFKKKPKKP